MGFGNLLFPLSLIAAIETSIFHFLPWKKKIEWVVDGSFQVTGNRWLRTQPVLFHTHMYRDRIVINLDARQTQRGMKSRVSVSHDRYGVLSYQ